MDIIDMRTEKGKPARAYLHTDDKTEPVEVDRGIPALVEHLRLKGELDALVQSSPDLSILLRRLESA